jgi:hypothetical protein
MAELVFVFLILIGVVTAFASSRPAEVVSAAKKLAVISAIDPGVNGQKVGITVFQNRQWTSDATGFDVNAVALATLQTSLKRGAKLIDGDTLGLIRKAKGTAVALEEKELGEKLAELGKEWSVDAILVIRSTASHDWIGGTNQTISPFGVYARAWVQTYCNLTLSTYDCATGRFSKEENVKQGQSLPSNAWKDTWEGYSANERRTLLRGLEAVTKDGVTALLAKVGLTEYKPEAKSTFQTLLRPSKGKSWLPEGNELEIPEGVSSQVARAAVKAGFKERGWNVTLDTDERIIGTLVEKNREAITTVTFSERSIVLVPERYEIRPDGQRVKIAPHLRWHKNLKETILETPFDTTPESQL